MVDIQNLKKTLAAIAAAAAPHREKDDLTEQDTKNALIEPILAAVGWSKSDLATVRAEYRRTSKDNPVDYALFAKDQPVLFVEAKALDVPIDDHKVLTQVISYANVSGVRWALITNGAKWALYKVFAEVQGERKLLFSIDITDPGAAEWLRWIAPDHVAGNDLDSVWSRSFAERQVRALLKKMIAERDSDLVGLLAHRSALSASDVAAGLYHLRVTFDEPEPGPLTIVEPPTASKAAATAATASPAASGHASAPVVAAGLVEPTPGSKPVRFWIGERTWLVRAWRDLPLNACAYLAETQPERFKTVFAAEEFQGRKRRLLSTTEEGLNSPVAVPGGFVELNLSSVACVDLAGRLLTFCGVDTGTAGYEAEADDASG